MPLLHDVQYAGRTLAGTDIVGLVVGQATRVDPMVARRAGKGTADG
jgi:hypothetical protein